MSEDQSPYSPSDSDIFVMELDRFLKNASVKFDLTYTEVIGAMFSRAVVIAIQGTHGEMEDP